MRTKLVYFSSTEDSKNGTIRGGVAMLLLLVISAIWYSLTSIIKKEKQVDKVPLISKIISIFLVLLLLGSAIAVQLPSSGKEAAFYGALVGLVTYGVYWSIRMMVSTDFKPITALIDTSFGVVSTGFVSWILYLIFFRNK